MVEVDAAMSRDVPTVLKEPLLNANLTEGASAAMSQNVRRVRKERQINAKLTGEEDAAMNPVATDTSENLVNAPPTIN